MFLSDAGIKPYPAKFKRVDYSVLCVCIHAWSRVVIINFTDYRIVVGSGHLQLAHEV